MSSDLYDLIHKDVERIPLPPSGEWTRRRRPATRRGRGTVVSAMLSLLVIVAALTGGQLLRGVRDRIEADHPVAGAGLTPGDDLIYLADGDLSAQSVQVVAMPTGDRRGRVAGQTYVGRAEEGDLMTVSGDVAYLPVAVSSGTSTEEYQTYLQPIDLRRGVPLTRIDTGIVPLPRALRATLPGTPAYPAATAMNSDGRTVWLVVDSGDQGEIAKISRLAVDAIGVASVRAGFVLQTVRPPAGGAVRSRLVALGSDHVAVVREHYLPAGARDSADWYIFDAQLNVIASFATDSAHRLPVGGLCGDVQSDPTGAGWVVLCSDRSGAGSGSLVFLDGTTFAVNGTVPLDRQYGYALGMATSADGHITVLTDRPVVVRIDARTRTFVDARPVTQRQSWFEQLLPSPAAAKSPGGPNVVFSPDAHYAYLAATPDRWWGPLSTIDLTAAAVVATNKSIGTVIGLDLSGGGERLYALTSDDQGNRSLVLLVPQTLGVVTRTPHLQDSPFAIVAVRSSGP